MQTTKTLAGAAALVAVAALAAGAVRAEGVTFDGAFAYSARDEVTDPDNPDESLDNDIIRLTTALNWGLGDGQMRAALELGATNNDFNGSYPADYGLELAYGRRVGDMRYGLGARVRGSDDLSTSWELAYGLQSLHETFDLRGLGGVQLVEDADAVRGRSESSLYGLAEATVYVTQNWAVSAAIQGDLDGAVWGAGTEYRGRRWGNFSVFLDYGVAMEDYRGVPSYDEFVGGIRYVPGASAGADDTLRTRRQSNLGVLMRRYVEVQ
ncbi:MAG: hypothetical protein JNK88_00660 [Mangrovicoccus sp.]|nr:hypothetical protein [Mangrovicoccus sp.]